MKCKLPKCTQDKGLLSNLTQCFKCGTYFSKKYSDPYCGVYVFCPKCQKEFLQEKD